MNPAKNRDLDHEARVRRARIERNLPIDTQPIAWPWIKREARTA